jgi:hypothetical protein
MLYPRPRTAGGLREVKSAIAACALFFLSAACFSQAARRVLPRLCISMRSSTIRDLGFRCSRRMFRCAHACRRASRRRAAESLIRSK